MTSPALLASLILLLYVGDCVRLLTPEQALLRTRNARKWRASFGSSGWQLGGREIAFANPFAPDEIGFVVSWHPIQRPPAGGNVTTAVAGRVPGEVARQIVAVGRFAWVSWVVCLLVLPSFLFMQLGPVPIIGAAIVLYANLVLCVAMLCLKRKRVGLSGSAALKLSLECLFCAPLGVNIARKLALLVPANVDLFEASKNLLDESTRGEVWGQARLRLAERMQEYDPGSSQFVALSSEMARWADPP